MNGILNKFIIFFTKLLFFFTSKKEYKNFVNLFDCYNDIIRNLKRASLDESVFRKFLFLEKRALVESFFINFLEKFDYVDYIFNENLDKFEQTIILSAHTAYYELLYLYLSKKLNLYVLSANHDKYINQLKDKVRMQCALNMFNLLKANTKVVVVDNKEHVLTQLNNCKEEKGNVYVTIDVLKSKKTNYIIKKFNNLNIYFSTGIIKWGLENNFKFKVIISYLNRKDSKYNLLVKDIENLNSVEGIIGEYWSCFNFILEKYPENWLGWTFAHHFDK